MGEPVFWGESFRGNSQGKKGDLGVLTRQLTSQEYTKRIVVLAESQNALALFVFPKIIFERRFIMKKSLNHRPHVLTVTRSTDKMDIKKFLDWEKHPRQKQTQSINQHLPIHLMF